MKKNKIIAVLVTLFLMIVFPLLSFIPIEKAQPYKRQNFNPSVKETIRRTELNIKVMESKIEVNLAEAKSKLK